VRTLFLRGSAWTLFDFGTTQAVRLVSNIILWRLLSAEAFGLMAIVTAVMVGLTMFSDVGIGPSIVQHKRGDDPDYLNTAWTIQVLRGIALGVAATLLAVPVARFYHQPQLAALISVVALTPVMAAFNSTRLFSAQRQVSLKRLTLVDVSAQVLGTVSMVAVAWLTRSVLALTVAWLVNGALRLVLGHLVLPGIRNRFRWDPTAVTALLRFGRWVFLSTLLTFLAMNADRLIFGRVLPIALLGIYGIAAVWANIPGQILMRVFSAVMFPVLSRAKNQGQAIGPVFRETREKALLAGAWMTSGLIAGAAPLIRVLYDARAADAIWIIPLVAVGGWFALLENSNSSAALALGRPKWMAAANGAKVIGMAALVPAGAMAGGFAGAIIGLTVADLFKYLVSAVGVVRLRVPAWPQDLLLTTSIGVISLGTLVLRRLIGSEGLPPIVDALIVTVVVTAAWALVWALRARRESPERNVLRNESRV
jgi:O-antigen/teichoic acid export membrane protein